MGYSPLICNKKNAYKCKIFRSEAKVDTGDSAEFSRSIASALRTASPNVSLRPAGRGFVKQDMGDSAEFSSGKFSCANTLWYFFAAVS